MRTFVGEANQGDSWMSGTCVLCLERPAVTRDHTPPKCIFSKPRPGNLITVPTCKRCNSSTTLDDELLRVLIGAAATPDKPRLVKLWEKVVESTLARSPKLKNYLRRDRERLQEIHRHDPIRDHDGKIIPDDIARQGQPFDADRISRVIVKTIRGLHYHVFGTPLPIFMRFSISSAPLPDDKRRFVADNAHEMIGGDYPEFLYWFSTNNPDTKTEWVLVFYLWMPFTIFVSPSAGNREEICILDMEEKEI